MCVFCCGAQGEKGKKASPAQKNGGLPPPSKKEKVSKTPDARRTAHTRGTPRAPQTRDNGTQQQFSGIVVTEIGKDAT